MKKLALALLFSCASLPTFAGVKEADIAMQKEDYKTALKEWTALAKKDNAEAQFKLGVMNGAGLGVEANMDVAVGWYSKAAAQNHPEALYVMSVAYDKGQGVGKDPEKFQQLLNKAAELGSTKAQSHLGSVYYSGYGVAQDFTQALLWYRKAAEQNDASAQFNLGNMYQRGKGVEPSEPEAIKWFTLAAEQNEDRAQNALGGIYMNRKDFAQGVIWLKKAAEASNTYAQADLSQAYFYGDGVSEDKVEAFKWAFIATEISHEEDARNLKHAIENKLNPAQIEQGQDFAIKWLKAHDFMR
jgi:uncharacterized protein